jgi:hypothetical protein
MVPCLTHDVLLDFHMTPGQLEVVVTPSLASVTRLEALKNENQAGIKMHRSTNSWERQCEDLWTCLHV